VAKGIPAEVVVNIQGDEPLVEPVMVDDLIEALRREPKAGMATLAFRIDESERSASSKGNTSGKGNTHSSGYTDPHQVKVVTDEEGWALYFSRSPIPHFRGQASGDRSPGRPELPPLETETQRPDYFWYKHIGLYAYRRECLEGFVSWPISPLERAEGLEQLRALEHGVRIKVLASPKDTIGIDTPDDVKRVEMILKNTTHAS
jgi:3-deoxy-manno-octulosonate cytidylyltransferase (CMP-KDO synthetase)